MLLRIQDRILLGLAFLGDLFEDVAGVGGLAGFSYKQIYGFVPRRYRKSNFQAGLYYALRTEKIKRIIKNGEVFLRLTGKGKKKLIRDFPLIWFQKKKWDGLWRVLPYDIREIKKRQRDRLRNKLYELGFKQFQKSVYLSPLPIENEMEEFLKTLKLEGKAHLLLSNKVLGIENRELAEKLWQVDKLNRKYKKLLSRLVKAGTEKELKEVRSDFFELLAEDPFLPKELLPKEWLRERVEREILNLN